MSYVLLIIYCLLLCWLITRLSFFKSEVYSKGVVLALFISKFLMGVGLVILYQYYYGERGSGDVFKYFDDGNIIHSAIYENPLDYFRMLTGIGGDAPHLIKYYDTCSFWFKEFNYGLINDNRIVIRFNALVRLISMRNIYTHTLFMSFFSFIGLWSILKVFESKFLKQKYLLALVVFFFPSVWFWTSGLLKEGILMGAFGIMFYLINRQISQSLSWNKMLGIFLCIFILLFSKFYVLVAAIPGLLCLIPVKRIHNPYVKFILIHMLCLALIYLAEPILGINFIGVLERKQHDFEMYVQSLSSVGSYIVIPDLEPNIWSIVKHAPEAFFNTFFRPTLFEANNAMMLMAAFENLLILAGLVFSLLTFSSKNLTKNYFLFSLSFVIVLFILSGLTTPVLGALVRYKAPALPFLGIMYLSLIDFNKASQWLKRIKLNKTPKLTYNE